MMTIPMDNTLDLASREHVQSLYNKNVELENNRRKAAQARIPSDPNAWQQMRDNYEAIVLEDHAFSEQHEIEYALWQLHYRRIEELRARFIAATASAGSATSQNGRSSMRAGPDRITKIRSQFKTFLSEATGFYHELMVKIRANYGLPLGYFSNNPENQILLSKEGNKSAEVKKGLLSCHRCLIYLGDLARYKGLYAEGGFNAQDFAAASSYYMQASLLWPSNGNPHHQLAILASYSGDEMVTVYRYFRSLAVDNPFTTARDNLIIAFEKNRQSYSQLSGVVKAASIKAAPPRISGKGRVKGEARRLLKGGGSDENIAKKRECSISETLKAFCIRFIRLNGILFTRTSLETFGDVFSMAKSDFLELLSSGPDEKYNFGLDAAECKLLIIRLVAILIFTVHNVSRETENQSYAEILQRSVLLQNAFIAMFEFMGHILVRCIQLNDPSTSYLLPSIMVFVEWLACHPDFAVGSDVEEKQAGARTFFWSNCISCFNKLLSSGLMSYGEDADETCFFNMSRYDESETANRLALPEDFELRGFLPLLPAQLILDFSRKHSFGNEIGDSEKSARIQRIIAAGKALANVLQVGEQGFYFDQKCKRFVIGVEPQISDDYLFSGSPGIPVTNGTGQESVVDIQMAMGGLQPKLPLNMEGEEEDEVIVFRPSPTEKHVDGSELLYSQVLGSVANASIIDLQSHVHFSAAPNDILLQNTLNTSSRPPMSHFNSSAEYNRPIQPKTSWMAQQGSIANGLTALSLLDDGHSAKPDLHDHIGFLPPAPLSVPFTESVNISSGHPVQFSEDAIPSKSDSIMYSGGVNDSAMKPLSVTSGGLRKNPVSRPVRHSGPPPGFCSVPFKLVDESFSDMPFKNENPSIDDYSWLDGYQLPSLSPGIGFNNSIGYPASTFHSLSKNNSSVEIVSFPFPGKQVPVSEIPLEHQKARMDYQFSKQLKVYQDQKQQLQKGNQQSLALPGNYQEQSFWEGRFFV